MTELVKKESVLQAWLKEKLAEGEKRLPFSVDFYPEAETDWADVAVSTESVGNIKIPVLNELTQTEIIIFDLLDKSGDSRTASLRITQLIIESAKSLFTVWGKICDEIEATLDAKGAAIATGEADKAAEKQLKKDRASLAVLRGYKPVQLRGYSIPNGGMEELEGYALVSEAPTYQEFVMNSYDILDKIDKLANGSQGAFELAKVGFFLASRVGVEWLEPRKLGRLTGSAVEAINKLIVREANKGKDPVAETTTDETETVATEGN